MTHQTVQCLSDSRGATTIEYALIAGFLSIAIAATVELMGGDLTAFFESVRVAFS